MSYPGSKGQAGVFQRIIGQMPPHSVYVEPFFGSGQVFWRKRRAASTIAIDLDPGVIAKVGAEAGVSAISGNARLAP
jgi:DNA adenine methylase